MSVNSSSNSKWKENIRNQSIFLSSVVVKEEVFKVIESLKFELKYCKLKYDFYTLNCTFPCRTKLKLTTSFLLFNVLTE